MAIRVLHITSSLGQGGAQVCVKYLVENAGSGVEPFVYPLRYGGIDISVNGEVAELAYPNYDVRKFFSILRLCREHRIDIIHAHLEKSILGGLLASYFCKGCVVVHEHGLLNYGYAQNLLDEHVSNRKDNARQLWLIFVFNYWWNSNIETHN